MGYRYRVYSFSNATLNAISRAGIMRAFPPFSRKNNHPMSVAKTTLVSRKAMIGAIAYMVIAYTTIAYASSDRMPPMIP